MVACTQYPIGFLRDDEGLLIDPDTGLPADPNELPFDLRDRSFKQRRLVVALTGSRGRNRFSLSGFYTTREFTSGADDDETIVGGAGSLNRRLTPQIDAGVNASLSATTEGGGGDDQIWRAGVFVGYNLSESLRGAIRYSFLHRQRDGEGDLTENVLAVSLRKDF